MISARPMPLGETLLTPPCPSMRILDTYSVSRFILKLFSALAAADNITFLMVTAGRLGSESRMATAWSIFFPLIRSATRRVLKGESRMCSSFANASILHLPQCARARCWNSVTMEIAGEGELTEPVPNHGLRDVDGNMRLAIMDGNRMSHHLLDHVRTTAPCLDELLLTFSVHVQDPAEQTFLDKALVGLRIAHRRSPSLYASKYTCRTGSSSCGFCSRERSEEHTSELQSRFDLVCRLLLEN